MGKPLDKMSPNELREHWGRQIAAKLEGRTIREVRYLDDAELSDLDWYRSGLFLVLDDGTQLLVSQDDEGNGPGAVLTNLEGRLSVLPVV